MSKVREAIGLISSQSKFTLNTFLYKASLRVINFLASKTENNLHMAWSLTRKANSKGKNIFKKITMQ